MLLGSYSFLPVLSCLFLSMQFELDSLLKVKKEIAYPVLTFDQLRILMESASPFVAFHQRDAFR